MKEVRFGKDRYHQQAEMCNWLYEHLGESAWGRDKLIAGYRWSWDSAFGNTFFYFRDEKDATMFILRWS